MNRPKFPIDQPGAASDNPLLGADKRDSTTQSLAEDPRDSQARLAGIIDSAMDAIVTVDTGQRILVFNRAAERMFLCPAAEAIGGPLNRFIPERFRAGHSAHIEDFGKTGVSNRAMAGSRAVFGLRSNGEEFPIEASISQVEAGGNKLYTVIMRDVTERERAEERFRQLIEAAPNGMVMVDRNGSILLVNKQIESSFGYTREELLGQPIEQLVPARFRERHPNFLKAFIESPSARPMGSGRDLYGLRKDGSEFPVEIGLNPLDTEHGLVVLGTIVDITERKAAEETLRRSQQQLAGVIGSAMDAIISVDEEQRIVLFNSAAERMFMYPADDAIGQPLDRFIPKRFRSVHKKHVEDFGRTNVTRRSMGSLGALFGLRADGSEFPIEASISQLESDGSKIFTVILRDITERKHAEEEVRKLTTELEHRVEERTAQLTAVNKELEAFSYSVSHDLRAPLRHINGFSQALMDDYAERLDETGREFLGKICDASREMAQMIDDVLKLARVTRSEMRDEPVDLTAMAEEIIADLQRLNPERSVSLRIEPGMHVSGDKRLLQFVLGNLIGNAWKFTGGNSAARIEFGSELLETEPVFFVKDNGAGFDMRYADKLFGAFQRLHSAEEFAGTGIGLATVKRIVERHGGRVWADAAPGEGATFYFTIPNKAEDSYE